MLNGDKYGRFDICIQMCIWRNAPDLPLNCFHQGATGGSALLVFQEVQPLLVLGLERHDEVVRGDLAPAVLVHLAREDVVQAW